MYNQKIEPHITFIRINPDDIALTLREVFESLANLSWINSFDDDYVRSSFLTRAQDTVKYIAENIIKETDDSVTSDSGEYVVSELARQSVVNELNYLNIPLGELIKAQKIGNPGFDFYSENTAASLLLFGEAKYLSKQNAYGSAFEQIVRFEKERRHIADLVDIGRFFSPKSLNNVVDKGGVRGKKGFIAAFASKSTTTEHLIENIKKNKNFQILSKHEELICVAVDI
jgi:hypothetical protein